MAKYFILLLTLLAVPCLAEIPAAELQKYATPLQNITCKELDFNSYHKVTNVKTNLLRTNPDRTHPNFAGKYLLLRNDFLFDTIWFVADCATGKFIKETFSPDHQGPKVEFLPGSAIIAVTGTSPKNTTPLEYHVFENEKWVRVEAPVTPVPPPPPGVLVAPSSTPSAATPTSEPQFSQFSTPVASSCKEIDFNSNDKAQNSKKNLISNTPDLTHPNFGGHYLLFKGDTIFQTYWLIADCNTGKFFSEVLTSGASFQKDSRLVKTYSSGNFATYYLWSEDDSQWIKVHGNNSIGGKTAKNFFEALPNPDKSTTLRFENLKCGDDHCSVDYFKHPNLQITGASFTAVTQVLKSLGTELNLKSGKCHSDNGKFGCDFEN